MDHVMKVAFLVFLLIFGAYLAGVRVHPEAISAPASVLSSPQGVELKFKDGQRAVGRIVKETPDGIIFNMDGAEMSFTNAEIVSRTAVAVPSSGTARKKDSSSLITYNPELSILNRIGKKEPEKKPAFQASSLWGTKSRPAVETSMPGTMSGAKAADPNSLMGIYQKSMSKESLDQWKAQATEALNGQGRNPFFEARDAAQAKASAADTSRSEAKLKELQESGY